MRQPSDLALYYTYWNLALENLGKADAWRIENEQRLSMWEDDLPMVFPGFYRAVFTGNSHKLRHLKGQNLPIAIWIEQQISPEGELLADEVVMLKTAHWKPIHPLLTDNILGGISLLLAWEKCRLSPVTKEMYDFAMQAYALDGIYRWFDTTQPKAVDEIPAPIELRDAPSLF